MNKQPQSVSVTQYDFYIREDQEDELDPHGRPHHFMEYNEAGEPVKEIRYNHAGEFEEMFVYEYDDHGLLCHESYSPFEGEVAEEKFYFRDEAGVIRHVEKRYQDGSVDTITFEYDSAGKLARKITVNDEGELEETETFEWNGEELTNHQVLDSDGDVVESPERVNLPQTETRETRNDAGQIIREEELDTEGEPFMTVNRTYLEGGDADEVEVLFNGRGKSMDRHYKLKYSYTFFE